MDSIQATAEDASIQHLPSHDYISPGMKLVLPDPAFPDMIVGNTSVITWPFLRRWVEHNWYADRHDPTTGFADRDESAILHNNAYLFQDKPALEIGCWRGWSAVHIALGVGTLDVIDPILGDAAIAGKIRASLAAAGVLDRITLRPGFSPDAVDALARETGQRWSFIFIDGNHDDDAPRRDAEAVMRHAADTAMVLFHDLASPHVAAGLRAMRDAGWNTMLYQTMQIMGVAWRGDIQPAQHQPDPAVFWTLPRHLEGFAVSGWTPPDARLKAGWWDGMTMEDRRNAALVRAQALEDDLQEARSALAAMDGKVQAAYAETIGVRGQLAAAIDRAAAEQRSADLLEMERDAVLARAVAAESAFAGLSRHTAALTDQVQHISEAVGALSHAGEYHDLLHKAEILEERIATLTTMRAAQESRMQAVRSAFQGLLDHNEAQIHVDNTIMELARWLAKRRVLIGLIRRPLADRMSIVRNQATGMSIGHVVTEAAILGIVQSRTVWGLLRRSADSADAIIGRTLLQGARQLERVRLEQIAAPARLPGFAGPP